MLRITVNDKPGTHDKPRTLTFQLEGRLVADRVQVLEECSGPEHKAILPVDLTEVTAIDAAGRACLVFLHRQGAEFIAADCLTNAIVAEISQEHDCDFSK
jgi:anti-anti-sigma regulatory factor